MTMNGNRPGEGAAHSVGELPVNAAELTRPAGPTQAKLTVRCRGFKPLIRNTLRGFAEINIAEMKLTIRDVAVHTKGTRCWAQLPAKPQVKVFFFIDTATTEKIAYIPLMHFDTRAVSDAFS